MAERVSEAVVVGREQRRVLLGLFGARAAAADLDDAAVRPCSLSPDHHLRSSTLLFL